MKHIFELRAVHDMESTSSYDIVEAYYRWIMEADVRLTDGQYMELHQDQHDSGSNRHCN